MTFCRLVVGSCSLSNKFLFLMFSTRKVYSFRTYIPIEINGMPVSVYFGLRCGLYLLDSIISHNLHHTQFSGIWKGISSGLMGGSSFSFLIVYWACRRDFSAFILYKSCCLVSIWLKPITYFSFNPLAEACGNWFFELSRDILWNVPKPHS